MSQCCQLEGETRNPAGQSPPHLCPLDHTQGKPVSLITLKSLLNGEALAQIDPENSYRFCPSPSCAVVYFSDAGQTFTTGDLKVPVFQKDLDENVPVCYCFDWSRERIRREIEQTGESQAVAAILAHVRAKRCGCEVNNPQGSCCLANVRETVNHYL